MKKYIVLSVNDNPDYLYFTPITCWAWRQFGWESIVMYQGSLTTMDSIVPWMDYTNISYVKLINGYRSDTITQLSRLYAACVLQYDDYIMTGDIDMIPLSDYWKPNKSNITVWGHDLTGYSHYPICYIGMTGKKWRHVMNLNDGNNYNAYIWRDLKQLPQAKSDDFYNYWFTDQDLITKRLKPYNPTIINRGQYSNGFARGRVDRGAWTLDHKEFIDCHMHHQIHHKGADHKFQQTMELLYKVWPNENFDWFVEYTQEFKKLTGHL